MSEFDYSVVIPTFKRPDMIQACLQSLADLDYPRDRIEVIVVDNGGPEFSTEAAAHPFASVLCLKYLVNDRNRGYGYSANRGMRAATGRRIMFLNDDARPSPNLLHVADALFESDPLIGCVGCRAIEDGYLNEGGLIGLVGPGGELYENFNVDCGTPIEVDHVYGFCYLFTREAFNRAGVNDEILLAKPYSSGDRIETDHCLNIRRRGLKVVYHPGMVARHLAKPRADYSERSLAWKVNSVRNLLYLYLKHYGLFGKKAAALRLTFLRDLGVLSLLRQPSRRSLAYVLTGIRARTSAYFHYVRYLVTPCQ